LQDAPALALTRCIAPGHPLSLLEDSLFHVKTPSSSARAADTRAPARTARDGRYLSASVPDRRVPFLNTTSAC
jgi:hypothetical protein